MGVAGHSGSGRAFARAGLLGNPSDAYGGAAIAFTVCNFAACVTVSSSPTGGDADGSAADLLEATARRYRNATGAPESPLHFQLASDIPFQVGLAGSSAIVIAALRALAAACGRPLTTFQQAELALAVEVEDLGIAAGPMDRVTQAQEGLLHMDFAGPRHPLAYTALAASLLPPLLIAWDPQGGSSSNAVHSDVRDRWKRGDPSVRRLMSGFREIVSVGTRALRSGDHTALRSAIDANFDLRARLFPIAERDREMVETARSHGAAAKQCGSGGACIVALAQASQRQELEDQLRALGYRTCSPITTRSEVPPR